MDKKTVWKYSKVALILGCIAAGSGLLIGATNMLTAPIIAENVRLAKLKSIYTIYGEDSTYTDEVIVNKNENYKYVQSYYGATSASGEYLGNAFVTEGKNAYGTIKMAVGINANEKVGKISTITLDQSFGSTIAEQYLGPYNRGERELDDTKCGATVGANLIKDMAHEALDYYRVEVLGQVRVTDEMVKAVYGEGNDIGLVNKVMDMNYPSVREYWRVENSTKDFVGSVIHATGKSSLDKRITILTAITPDHKISKISVVGNDHENADAFKTEVIDKYNAGEITLDVTKEGLNEQIALVKQLSETCKQLHIAYSLDDIARPHLSEVYGSDVTYGERNKIYMPDNEANRLRAYYEVKKNGSLIGYVFYAENIEVGKWGPQTLNPLFGIDLTGKYGKIYLVSNTQSYADQVQHDYVDKVNDGSIKLEDTTCGATSSANKLKGMVEEGIAYFNANLKEGK